MHVSETGQHMGCLPEAAVPLVVPPQQIHVVHLILILPDHMHEVILQVWRIHLDNRNSDKELLINVHNICFSL